MYIILTDGSKLYCNKITIQGKILICDDIYQLEISDVDYIESE